MTSSHVFLILFILPDAKEQKVELYSIPRVGETVFFNGRYDYKVADVVNDVRKRSGVFGKMGMYINRITVVLEKISY